jgi:hypothetical protein
MIKNKAVVTMDATDGNSLPLPALRLLSLGRQLPILERAYLNFNLIP